MNKENYRIVLKNLNEDLTLSLVGFTYTTYFSLAVNQDDHSNPMSKDFNDENLGTLKPNELYQNMIGIISNHTLSIIKLIEGGLDTSARALLRVLAETIYIFIIVFSSKEHFLSYCNGLNDEDARLIWYKFFTPKKTEVELRKIESRIGLPDKIISEINSMRTSIYKEFSSVIHSSAYTSIIGSYAFDFHDDKLHIGIGGKASKASKNTLATLNWLLFYFALMTKGILNQIFEFKPRSDNQMWRVVFPIRECFIGLYLKITYKDEYVGNSLNVT